MMNTGLPAQHQTNFLWTSKFKFSFRGLQIGKFLVHCLTRKKTFWFYRLPSTNLFLVYWFHPYEIESIWWTCWKQFCEEITGCCRVLQQGEYQFNTIKRFVINLCPNTCLIVLSVENHDCAELE